MSVVEGAVKLSPWFWLLSPELQELIVWMVMRPRRLQMLACLYNPNPTNRLLPQKLWGTSWHPGDGTRPSHSHMPPARPIVKKKKEKRKAHYNNKVVCCRLQWLYGTGFTILEEWKEKRKRNIWFFIETHWYPKQFMTYTERLMFCIWCMFFW